MSTSAPAPEAAVASERPSTFFGDHIQKGGVIQEGAFEALRGRGFESLAGKLSQAKDEDGALSILNHAIQTASRRELKGAPNETWSDAEKAEFRRAYGVPEKPEDYKFKPEKPAEGTQWDDNTVKGFEELMHKHHVPAGFAKEASEFYSKIQSDQAQRGIAELDNRVTTMAQQTESHFRKDWGDDYDQRLEANKAFVSTVFKPEDLNDPIIRAALSDQRIVSLIDEARRSRREGTIPGTGREMPTGSMSLRQQASEIMRQNPHWQTDPGLSQRVNQLFNEHAAREARAAGKR